MSNVRRYVLAPDAVLQGAGDEALILKLSDETIFSLNATGARIAQLIVDGLDVDALIEALVSEYGASRSEVGRDVDDILRLLVSRGLLVAADGSET